MVSARDLEQAVRGLAHAEGEGVELTGLLKVFSGGRVHADQFEFSLASMHRRIIQFTYISIQSFLRATIL